VADTNWKNLLRRGGAPTNGNNGFEATRATAYVVSQTA